MKSTRIRNAVAAVAATACVASLVGIATGAASPSHNSKRAYGTQRSRAAMPFPGPPGGPPGVLLRRGAHVSSSEAPSGPPVLAFGGAPVHSEMVVPNKAGDGFETITQDSGKVDSVSGDQLSITEGTKQATYKTVTLDIPSDAKVIRNGKSAQLSDLQQGDYVHVSQSPQGGFVFAADASFQPKFSEHVAPPPPGAAGMPPGLPPMPGTSRQRH